jgi:hypothetical protein
MNLSTGLYRLAQVIKWIGRLLGGIWLIFSFTLLASDKAKVIDGFKNGDEFIWFILSALSFLLPSQRLLHGS